LSEDDDLILIARQPNWQKPDLKARFAALKAVYKRERRRYMTRARVVEILRFHGDTDAKRTVKRLTKQGVFGVHK
jgi:hypothetical protein